MNKNKKRTRKSKMIESESPVTSVSASPNKPPPSKKQKTAQSEANRKLSITDINGRMTTNVSCQVSGVVILKTGIQQKKGKWGSFTVSRCTILDSKGNSMDIKSYKQQAASDSNKYECFREIEVVFPSKNVTRTDLRYNGGDNKFFIKNPTRLTMTPTSTKTKLAAIKFDSETIEEIQSHADQQSKKINLCGIVTEVQSQQFNGNDGLMVRINDATSTQRHVFYETVGINSTLIKPDEFIFIFNANIQEKDGYINADGGIPLDVNIFKTLKTKQKQLQQMQEKNGLFQWKPTEYDFETFTETSVKKFNRLIIKCKQEGDEFELKEKYKQILLKDVEIADFINLCDVTYQSLKNDKKCKKLSDEQLIEVDSDEVISVWKLEIIISDGTSEPSVTLFNAMGDKLMSITAQQWNKSSEHERKSVIDEVFESKFDMYLTLQKKEHKSGHLFLRTNVVNIKKNESV